MGYKLNGTRLQYCAEHIVSYRKQKNGRHLYVNCDDKDAGERVYMYLSGIYKPKSYDKGFGWKDFTMIFPGTYERDAAYKDMNGAITEYIEGHPDLIVDGPDDDTPLNTPAPETMPSVTEEPEPETSDWTTYIIIGVAAVAIILLLWDRKK